MKKIILIFTVLAFTCLSSASLAQKVTSYSGYTAVIDNDTLAVGAIKTPNELAGQKMSNGQMKSHDHEDVINKKMSPRFAVAKVDISKSKEWAKSLTACAEYKEGDNIINVWRVPTQRELMLIYQMKAKLEAISNFTAFTAYNYWSSTEYSSEESWSVYFVDGDVYDYNKYGNNEVRCIRDL